MSMPVSSVCRLYEAIMLWSVTYGPSDHGRGVYATKAFTEGELIERCPLVIIPRPQLRYLDKTELYNYYFDWNGDAAFALGLGSLYNHSYSSNARCERDQDRRELHIIAQRPIAYGEEICINYLGEPDSKGYLWFSTDEYPL